MLTRPTGSKRIAFREQAHRRLTLIGIAGLLLLSTSPVFGHHLPIVAASVFSGVDHIGALCLVALHELLSPVHELFHIVILAGVAYAAWDRVRAWRGLRRSTGMLETRKARPGDPFWNAAIEAGVDPKRVRIVVGLPNPAFTVGFLRPLIYVADSLPVRLQPAQLAAVLAHEGAHVTRRDPLRLASLRALACTLFWMPALRRLADDVADEAEVRADDAAAKKDPLVLAGAILAIAGWHSSAPDGVVEFQHPDLLDRRVRRLAGEDTMPRSHMTRRSLVMAALALTMVWTSGLLVAHPLAAESIAHREHCQHHHGFAVGHLFCRGRAEAAASKECPHTST